MLLRSYVEIQKRMIHGKASNEIDYRNLSDAKSKHVTRLMYDFCKRKLLRPKHAYSWLFRYRLGASDWFVRTIRRKTG